MHIKVFQHVEYENLSEFEPIIKDFGIQFEYISGFRRSSVLLSERDWEKLDGIIVMGGPMSVHDSHDFPFLKEELQILERAFKKEVPILGICLGSQLIAQALGAQVYVGEKKEIGWYPLFMNAQSKKDSLFEAWPESLMMFQWHGETFDLPEGAKRIASSTLYQNQAFVWNQNVYAIQFHPEMNLMTIKNWLKIHQKEVRQNTYLDSPEEIIEKSRDLLPRLANLRKSMLLSWLDLLKNKKAETRWARLRRQGG
ncbi:MAG: gamma-glutamyl-gamma-aminobutyrate hydrolase family protein [Deltaproteobacteria bacterium]|nr:gamma-glutamyl-gamma-aminobutyrate hydrolase family protein [Deltaproteobacteria bacterium]